ncbi:MAG TPA: glucoamylase family protein [Puia sp.]|nr:glucoamylase family protein [Puia sp.]
MKKTGLLILLSLYLFSCQKHNTSKPPVLPPFKISGQAVNGVTGATDTYFNVNKIPLVKFAFAGGAIDRSTVSSNVSFSDNNGTNVPVNFSYENDSTLDVQPLSALKVLSKYKVQVSTGLKSKQGASLQNGISLGLVTAIDSSDKFPRISDSALLTLVQQQTFKYFWDFGHPVSGLARERNTSADVVTTGGSGFGVMSVLVGIQRNFISRTDGLARINQIVSFLTGKAQRYHGAFPHWLNGSTGVTVPFSTQDDGADLVETAYMMQGLLSARQYFTSTTDSNETNLRNNINAIWNGVDWNWFRQNGQNTLYWHWSPDFNWSGNQQISGWNEALITYVLAASANVDSIPKAVYDNGWARNGNIKNGNLFYGIQLPLGPDLGGPLFFAHYSFMGINPNNLSDAYANYWTQNVAHSKINFSYCVANPGHFNGYSNLCWGLTASDEENGYSAHAPDNDDGVISPAAAISSIPYTPTESMNALRFFYYTLGDRIWGQYGFVDAFNLSSPWFANSFLAIDQGPQIVMIENYRSGLLWNLFLSCPEIKRGMTNLGFQSPNL